MRSQRGITLTSLIIYIIAMLIIISIVSVVSTYFYKNIRNVNTNVDSFTEYTRFNSYFTDEANKENIKILECKENYIVFDNETQYTYVAENKGIYKNKVKICEEVESCKFSTELKKGNDIVKVEMTIDGKEYSNQYTLKK